MLSVLIFLPLLVALGVAFAPSQSNKTYQGIAILLGLVQCVMTCYIFLQLPTQNFPTTLPTSPTLLFVEQYQWFRLPLGALGTLAVDYFVGVDSLNAVLLCLSALVLLVAAVASVEIKEQQKTYFALFFLLNAALMGCFAALDLFLFFLFFEFMLLPLYFLIGLWGGQRREYAAIKFFIYTFVGSLAILLVLIGLGLSVTTQINGETLHTFSWLAMTQPNNFIENSLLHPANNFSLAGFSLRSIAFLALLFGFAIKLPAVPLHTWLPDAHTEAPTPVSIILAGVLLKIGGYGIIRIGCSVFPAETYQFANLIAIVGVFSIGYGGFVALGQTNLKRLIAYSSISHMGFVLLGIGSQTEEGMQGAVYQLVSHGILSAMLFLLAGFLYRQTADLAIENYKGLLQKMPQYSFFTAVAFFASLGLPAFSGFIGEMLTLVGAFHAKQLAWYWAVAASLGLLLSAAYFLWTYQRMFLGSFSLKNSLPVSFLQDLDLPEKIILWVLTLLTLLLGLFPNILLSRLAAIVSAI